MSRHQFGLDGDMEVPMEPAKQSISSEILDHQHSGFSSSLQTDIFESDEAIPQQVLVAL